MPEELGKIEKPPVENFKTGRKLYFVPLVFSAQDLPLEYVVKYNHYWEQVEEQITNLEIKLGPVNRLYHEMIPESGEEGFKTLEQLNVSSVQIIRKRMITGATLEALEDKDILTELMDWSRCLSLGLQNQKVFSTVYNFYTEANNKRNEAIGKRIDETLKENESAVLIMGEGHHVKFPDDVSLFYVAPPALDEIKRWVRDYEAKAKESQAKGSESEEQNPPNPITP